MDSEFDSESEGDEDNETDVQFDAEYENASITLCGAFCAIMEFKRSCSLSFSCVDKLLDLLQLFCPPVNTLPRTSLNLTMSRSFFVNFLQSVQKVYFVLIVTKN